LATLIGSLLAAPRIAAAPDLAFAASAACVLLAGIWQLMFAFLRIGALIKFTPHTVFAGFMNGAALVIIRSQVLALTASPKGFMTRFNATELTFVALISAIAIFYSRLARFCRFPRLIANVPGTMVAFAGGMCAGTRFWIDFRPTRWRRKRHSI
jgi:MFS superfamily sulfate permease-like transporter